MRNIASAIPIPCMIRRGDEDGALSELVFMSSQRWHKQLKYGETLLSGGFLLDFDMTSNFGFDEVWAFHETEGGEVYISPRRDEALYLSCDENGDVKVVSKINESQKNASGQIWKVSKPPEDYEGYDGVVITCALLSPSATRKTLYLCTDGKRITTAEEFTSFAVWDLQRAHEDNYSLTITGDDSGLSFQDKDIIAVDQCRAEVWSVDKVSDDVYVFYLSSTRMYLAGYTDHGNQVMLTETLSDKCFWQFDQNQCGGTILKHKRSGKYIVLQKKGVAVLVTDKIDATTLSLNPSVPQYKPLVSRRVKMVGLAGVAAPLAVTGVVAALGFSSTGIIAGSTAARLMSATAIASGGGVPAGSAVAIAQSIGAAGLGTCGTAVSASVGAGVASLTTSNTKVENETSSNAHDEGTPKRKRIFSEWKYW